MVRCRQFLKCQYQGRWNVHLTRIGRLSGCMQRLSRKKQIKITFPFVSVFIFVIGANFNLANYIKLSEYTNLYMKADNLVGG